MSIASIPGLLKMKRDEQLRTLRHWLQETYSEHGGISQILVDDEGSKKVRALLLDLESQGVVQQHPNGRFIYPPDDTPMGSLR